MDQMSESARNKESELFGEANPVAAYLKEISRTGKLTSKEEKTLAARISQGDMAARNMLVQANLKFVVAVCRNYEHQGLPMADLINEGNLGLMRAAARFDEHRNCRFISYAVWWIRQGIMSALAEQSRDLNLSTSTTSAIHRISISIRHLSQKLGRDPSLEDLELETGFKAGRIKDCLELMGPSLSLDFPGKDGESSFGESIPDEGESRTEILVDQFQTRRALEAVVNGLNRKERLVIESFFGLGTGNSSNLKSLAKTLGVSKERVRQLKAQALAKLKSLLLVTARYPCISPDGLC
jgi:RNA polymerase primary sigma factor